MVGPNNEVAALYFSVKVTYGLLQCVCFPPECRPTAFVRRQMPGVESQWLPAVVDILLQYAADGIGRTVGAEGNGGIGVRVVQLGGQNQHLLGFFKWDVQLFFFPILGKRLSWGLFRCNSV